MVLQYPIYQKSEKDFANPLKNNIFAAINEEGGRKNASLSF